MEETAETRPAGATDLANGTREPGAEEEAAPEVVPQPGGASGETTVADKAR